PRTGLGPGNGGGNLLRRGGRGHAACHGRTPDRGRADFRQQRVEHQEPHHPPSPCRTRRTGRRSRTPGAERDRHRPAHGPFHGHTGGPLVGVFSRARWSRAGPWQDRDRGRRQLLGRDRPRSGGERVRVRLHGQHSGSRWSTTGFVGGDVEPVWVFLNRSRQRNGPRSGETPNLPGIVPDSGAGTEHMGRLANVTVIDWDVAVNTGIRLVRPGPQVGLSDARQAVVQLRELSAVAAGHVRDFTKMNPLEPAGPAVIVDRPGWIRANVDGFRVVLEPVLEQMGAERLTNGPAGNLAGVVGSRITGVQLGAVLAYLAGKVLGQYELFLPPDPDGNLPTGRLTLVAPNIVNTERELDVDPRDFRLWVCLHEETHRMQFTATPWLREYVQELMQELLLSSEMDA